MSTKTEVMTIAELAFDLNTANPGRSVHCTVGPAASINVTVFTENGEIDWQQNLYEWSHDEAFLPKLRWLRNELEQMLAECELPILMERVA